MPSIERIEFPNGRGERLAAALVRPSQGPARACALFAHCFTCGKNSAAASRISRALAGHGISVLRFDFTGLGGSEGDFANTSFSSNIEDLVAAADWLRQHHGAPNLLIGHSLGGTAVLAAAPRVPECTAVVTLGAPAAPDHLLRHAGAALSSTSAGSPVEVQIAGKSVPLARGFVDDLQQHPLPDRLGALRRALLVMHAPLDPIVAVDEASRIFQAARHPKSFVSLDGADHLLSKLADAQYAADTIGAWAQRYLPPAATTRPEVTGGEVLIGEANQRFLRDVYSDDHHWLADEPRRMGGENLGPDPYEHLLAALGTCTSMTLRMYANRKQWPLTDVDVRLLHRREHAQDCEDCEGSNKRLDIIERQLTLHGDLSAEQRQRLLEIADRCPVHRTLEGDLRITTALNDPVADRA